MSRAGRWTALVLIAATLSGCGFAEKKRLADRIRGAPERMAETHATATARLSVSLRIVESNAQAALPAGLTERPSPPFVTSGPFDYRARRSASAFTPPGREPIPLQVFDRTALYQRRMTAPGTAAPSRSWLMLDLATLYDDRERQRATAIGSNLLGPTALLDLVRGSLTGSVRREAAEPAGGVAATRYRVNVDLEKAVDGLPDATREAFESARALGGLKRVVHPGRVWLDGDGLVRRFEVRLRQERSRNEAVELIIGLELSDLGSPVEIAVPTRDEVAVVRDVGSLGAAGNPLELIGGASRP